MAPTFEQLQFLCNRFCLTIFIMQGCLFNDWGFSIIHFVRLFFFFVFLFLMSYPSGLLEGHVVGFNNLGLTVVDKLNYQYSQTIKLVSLCFLSLCQLFNRFRLAGITYASMSPSEIQENKGEGKKKKVKPQMALAF